MDCYSGFTIFLIWVLLSALNGYTLNSGIVSLVLFVGAIVFYLNQRDWRGCTYPDPNR